MSPQEMDELSAPICEFYNVDMQQIRGSHRTSDIVVARCALATELDAAKIKTGAIARYMGKTEPAVRAMVEQYEARASALGFPLYVSPHKTAKEPGPTPQEKTPAQNGAQALSQMILGDLLNKAGGPRRLESDDPMPPLYGLSDSEARDIAISAHTDYEVSISDIADFFAVHALKVAIWLSLNVKDEAPGLPREIQNGVTIDDEPEPVQIVTTDETDPDDEPRIADTPADAVPARPQLEPAQPPASNLLNYIDRADLYATAQYLVENQCALDPKLRQSVQRILMSLVDAVFDALPPPESDMPRMLPIGFKGKA